MPQQAIVIMTDSQRFDMVGAYGNRQMRTPFLDAFAETCLRFERAYTAQPVCGPARSAIFTGLFPHSNGSWTNSVSLYDNVKTVGQRLSAHGIRCAFIGKWHLDGGDYFGLGRCPDGWDKEYWYDMKCYLEELSPEERLISRNGNIVDSEEGVERFFTFGARCTTRALDFMQRYKDEDYLLVVSYDEPHDPALCPKPYPELFRDYEFPRSENVDDTLEGKPSHQKAWAGERLTEKAPEKLNGDGLRHFFGCNSFIDSEIGRVIDCADTYARDAFILYTSDHGDAISSHRLFAKGPCVYDEIARIPFLLRWPGHTSPASLFPHPVSHIDITPTLLDYFGLPEAHWIEGRSLRRIFDDNYKPEPVFIEFGRYEVDHDGFGGFQPMRGIIFGKYKLAIHLLSEDEFYNTEEDPAEMHNLINDAAYSDERDRMHDLLLDWMNRTRDPFRGYWWERRPWREDALDATWDYTAMTRQREHEEFEPRQLDYMTGLEMDSAVRVKAYSRLPVRKKRGNRN